MRASIGLAAVFIALGGLSGAAHAQAYPDEYYPLPPEPYSEAMPPYGDEPGYGPPGGYYQRAPYVYRDANGMPLPPYQQGYGPPGYGQPGYGPPARPYFVPPPGGDPVMRPPGAVGAAPDVTGAVGRGPPTVMAALPPEDRPEMGPARELPPQLRRQLVDYSVSEPAGTIIIDTPHTFLYLVLGNRKALRYGIGVGREGFTWSGSERISRMSQWPDWHPPKEMIERQPYLPRFMAGGEGNPLGARALYLGNTLYRIHGTNQPSTIGHFVSSGCIRLTNEDIADLYSRVNIGTRVVVLSGAGPSSAAAPRPMTR